MSKGKKEDNRKVVAGGTGTGPGGKEGEEGEGKAGEEGEGIRRGQRNMTRWGGGRKRHKAAQRKRPLTGKCT